MRFFTLILLGKPGSGKDTQGIFLARKFNAKVFASGKAMRDLEKRDHGLRKSLLNTISKGVLADSDLYKRLVLDFLTKVPRNRNIILIGNPRKLTEAKFVLRILKNMNRSAPFVIYLNLPEKEILKRSNLRLKKEYRADDLFIKRRLLEHKKYVEKTLLFFQNNLSVKEISAVGTVLQVQARINKEMERLLKLKNAKI